MFKRLLLVYFWSAGFTASIQAQNILTDNIQWNATTLTDLSHNATVNAPCQFKTTGTLIDWIQGNGSYVQSFTVQNTSGTWPDLIKPGSIIFSVKAETLTGNVTVSRDNNGLTIKVVLSGGTDSINILYMISTFQKL